MKYLCYINNKCIEEIFLLPSPFWTFPSRYLFKGTLWREIKGGFVLGFQSIRNLSSCNEDAGSQNVKKEMVLCVKKQQLCTCNHTFWHFFLLLNATFYGGCERAATNFFLSWSLFLKIAAFFLPDAK